MHVNVTLSDGSKGGWGRAPGPISCNFMQFSGENGQNDKFAPPLLGLAPPLGNPGSATAIFLYKWFLLIKFT